jgi:hypothetical protein
VGKPAILVDAPVACHLEVLRGAARLRLAVIEGVEHADAMDGLLSDTMDDLGLGQPDCLQDSRGNIDDVVPLRAQAALLRDVLRPMDHHRLADAWWPQAKGVAPAKAQPLGYKIWDSGPPNLLRFFSAMSRGSGNALNTDISLNAPLGPPWNTEPLSPVM